MIFQVYMFDCLKINCKYIKKAIISSLIQYFEADFLWKVSLKILNSGIILKTFTHADKPHSAVGDVSDCRYLSDYRSRGREFDPSQVPYFYGD